MLLLLPVLFVVAVLSVSCWLGWLLELLLLLLLLLFSDASSNWAPAAVVVVATIAFFGNGDGSTIEDLLLLSFPPVVVRPGPLEDAVFFGGGREGDDGGDFVERDDNMYESFDSDSLVVLVFWSFGLCVSTNRRIVLLFVWNIQLTRSVSSFCFNVSVKL